MNHKLQNYIIITASVIIGALFLSILLMYISPMKDITLDLSLGFSDEATFDKPSEYDDKGWTVYTKNGEDVTELTPDGFGGYTGLELGQTFYYSRLMDEELDAPTLELGAGEQNFSIWLGDTLIYTDCPELDNRIGFVTLPMNSWLRDKPILISLPSDYRGKVLTIAQAFPEYSETASVRAYPASVRLYCGYAYESGIISESFTTAIYTVFMFGIGAFLLAFAVHSRDISVACLSAAAFLNMTSELVNTSFYYEYFGSHFNALGITLPMWTSGALLLFLVTHAGKHKKILGIQTIAFLLSVSVCGIASLSSSKSPAVGFSPVTFFSVLSEWLAFICLLTLLIMGTIFWRKENRFYRLFIPISLVLIPLFWISVIFFLEKSSVLPQLSSSLKSFRIAYVYYRTIPAISAAALFTAIFEAVRGETNRRIEKRLLEERRNAAIGSYENIRRQNEEVMMLRHDMSGHFEALRGMLNDPEKAARYLDSLIGQNKNIRSVVQTGNEVLDIILNHTVARAEESGIHVDIINAKAPKNLTISDKDLSSIVMNITNNALSAAKVSESASPYIRIDIHERSGYLAITCENTANMKLIRTEENDQTVPKHGLGLKIIRNIVDQNNGLMETEYSTDSYKIRIAIPLFNE